MCLGLLSSCTCLALPEAFSYLTDPRIVQSMDYAGSDNFVGKPVAGYQGKVCILTKQAHDALVAVQDDLSALQKGYILKVFDCYRPTMAVADFKQWSENAEDNKTKDRYYPDFEKSELFKLGYVSTDKSSHSRGSTVDLTIAVRDKTGQMTELDMGTPFDFFGKKAHTDSKEVSALAQQNRQLLKTVMEKHGFKNYEQEWWHYTLVKEPFPDTYFDFPVKK